MSEEPRVDDSEATSRPPQGLVKLADRCAAANIHVEWQELADEDDGKWWNLYVFMPNGRTTRRLLVSQGGDRKELLTEVDFTKYTFIGDYEAIASYSDRYIEAGLTGGTGLRRLVALSNVQKISLSPNGESTEVSAPETELSDSEAAADDSDSDTEDEANVHLTVEAPEVSWRLELSPASNEFLALRRAIFIGPRQQLTLKLLNVSIGTHETALQLLEDVLGSFLFDLELRHEFVINLQRARLRRSRAMRRRPEGYVGEIQLPRTKYPREPLELYWYARSANGMPLLQYLAYYQAIEFFFTVHSRSEALTRIRNELRDPRFNFEDDSHLGRILGLATVSGSGFGAEREQLKATLRACLDAARLREFFSDDPRVEEHFTGKQQIRGVQRIELKDLQADLRDQVSSRIYDLRCRIVHTKDEPGPRDTGLLLPFSEEADRLSYDIELIRFACQKVLIAGGSAIRLPM
jgi:hypothetical protein